MKSKLLLFLLASIVLVYAGCKKSSTPAIATVSPQVVASQLAVNLSESLNGGLGGFDVFSGLSGATSFSIRNKGVSFALHPKGRFANLLTNPVCGAVVDTTVNFTDNTLGLTSSIVGEIKFTFNCTANVVSGFTNYDNITITLGTADTSFTYKVLENVTIAELNPGVSSSNISLNGSLNSNLSYQIKSGSSKGNGTAAFNYTFNNVVISQTNGIVSGSATFNTTSSGPQGTWNYSGTITFLGNGAAKITINGITFNVNLDTGSVS